MNGKYRNSGQKVLTMILEERKGQFWRTWQPIGDRNGKRTQVPGL